MIPLYNCIAIREIKIKTNETWAFKKSFCSIPALQITLSCTNPQKEQYLMINSSFKLYRYTIQFSVNGLMLAC